MDILKKLNSPPRSALLRDFQNQEWRITIPKSRIRLGEKQEDEQTIAKHYAFHADAVMSFDINLDQKSIRYQKFWHIQRLKMCLKFKTKGL